MAMDRDDAKQTGNVLTYRKRPGVTAGLPAFARERIAI
jgi:hypothetical protein